jgi:hypothetical protein
VCNAELRDSGNWFEVEKNDIRAESEFLLKYFNTEVIRFDGTLGIDYIRTESHPVQKFTVDGILKSSGGKTFQILGEGTLTHLYYKNGISCLLDLSFHLSRDDITRSLLSTPDVERIHMEVVHTIMDKRNIGFGLAYTGDYF